MKIEKEPEPDLTQRLLDYADDADYYDVAMASDCRAASDRLVVLEALHTRLSVLTSCSSPDGSAELGQVELAMATHAVKTLEALRDRLQNRAWARGVDVAIEVLQGNEKGW